MNKTTLKYIVDIFLLVCMLGIIIIGFLLAFVIAEGPTASEASKYFLNLHRHQWSSIHLYLGLAFSFFLIVHLILSWKWIKANTKKIFKKGWGLALIFFLLLSIVVVLLFWMFTPKHPGQYDEYGTKRGERGRAIINLENDQQKDLFVVTGQMTLKDVEKATGIHVQKIIETVKLPTDVSLDETLGWLRKKHGLSLVEFREAIDSLLETEPEPSRELPTPKTAEEKPAAIDKIDTTEESIEHEKKVTRGVSAEDQSGILITGRMTLLDLERETGISARKIASKLGLPESASLNENLGRLRRQYGFSMQDIRDAISALIEKK